MNAPATKLRGFVHKAAAPRTLSERFRSDVPENRAERRRRAALERKAMKKALKRRYPSF